MIKPAEKIRIFIRSDKKKKRVKSFNRVSTDWRKYETSRSGRETKVNSMRKREGNVTGILK